LLLLELKDVLEGLTKRIAPHEVSNLYQIPSSDGGNSAGAPNQPFGRFLINPLKPG